MSAMWKTDLSKTKLCPLRCFSEQMSNELAFLAQMCLEIFFGGRVLDPIEPKNIQRLKNLRRVYPMSVCFPRVVQIGDNGARLLLSEDRQTISRVVGKSHG